MSQPNQTYASQIERAEAALVDHLKSALGNDVRVEAQPDDPENFDMAGASRLVLVHFGASRPASRNAVALAGPVTYAVIVLSRSLREASGGYALLERVERALAGACPEGLRAIAVRQSTLEGQSQGIWRWVVEVETELQRGAAAAAPATFLSDFGERP